MAAATAAATVRAALTADATRIGWVGVGVMGSSMLGNMMKAGYGNVTCFSRTISKCDVHRDAGATIASTPREVGENSDIVFTIVGYPSDVRQVILDEDTGVLAGMREGGILVDMTTSEPALAQEIFDAAAAKGVSAIDAPVSGGDVGARNGTLSIMIGGEESTVDHIRPLLDTMGKNINYMGPAGSGQNTKAMNQIIISTNMIGMVEGLLFAYKSGLDVDAALRAVSSGAAGSWSVSNLAPRIVQRDFRPGFEIGFFVKDLGIALDAARRMNLSLPGTALAQQFYMAACAQGLTRKGTHALARVFESMNNIDMSQPLQDADCGTEAKEG